MITHLGQIHLFPIPDSVERYIQSQPLDLTRKRYWRTPPELLKSIYDEFHIDFDPCPNPRPKGFDGLLVDWGKSNYVNPPFGPGLCKWGHKAIYEQSRGNMSVFILPFYQTRVISLLCCAGAELKFAGCPRWLDLLSDEPQPLRESDLLPCLFLILKPKTC